MWLGGGVASVDMLKAIGTVIFDEIDPPKGQKPTEFQAYLTGAPIVVAGYGGWSRVSRPRKKAITEWVGRDSVSIELPFLIDTLEDNQGIFTEDTIGYLEYLAAIGKNEPSPPLFQLKTKPAPLMPHGFHRANWVKWFVEILSWERETIIVNQAGNRIRAGGTVTVTQFVQDDKLAALSGAQKDKASNPGGGRRKTYIVKKGDTLHSIAARKDVYGDAKKWKKIADANGIRDSKGLKKLIGKEIKIP
jgi:hypothetical protein